MVRLVGDIMDHLSHQGPVDSQALAQLFAEAHLLPFHMVLFVSASRSGFSNVDHQHVFSGPLVGSQVLGQLFAEPQHSVFHTTFLVSASFPILPQWITNMFLLQCVPVNSQGLLFVVDRRTDVTCGEPARHDLRGKLL